MPEQFFRDKKLHRLVLLGFIALFIFVLTQKNSAENIPPAHPLETQVHSFDGQSWPLSRLAQGKVMVVNFWGSFCPPCLEELPIINRLAHQYSDSVVFVGLAVGSTISEVKKVVEFQQIKYPIAQVAFSTLESWGSSTLPSVYIIDTNGKIVWSHEGSVGEAELKSALTSVL